jgi:hypothetical protein
VNRYLELARYGTKTDSAYHDRIRYVLALQAEFVGKMVLCKTKQRRGVGLHLAWGDDAYGGQLKLMIRWNSGKISMANMHSITVLADTAEESTRARA